MATPAFPAHIKIPMLMCTRVLLLALCVVSVCSVHVQILATTDIHGWVLGHRHINDRNVTLGDLRSLASHLEAKASATDSEFFMFDSGDLTEGTGVSDAVLPHGRYIFDAYKQVPYTALTVGNHDIGKDDEAKLIAEDFAPFWEGKYVTSNVEYLGNRIGSPYQIIERSGLRILVLGFLYNFEQAAPSVTVTNVAESIKEQYFLDAMAEQVDAVVVLGHISPEQAEIKSLHRVIREAKPETPIIMLVGHYHMKKWLLMDPNCFVIESGHFLLDVGVLQFSLEDGVLTNMNHEFINASRHEFVKLAGVTDTTFDTPEGKDIDVYLQNVFDSQGLSKQIGCPTKYYPRNALFPLYLDHALPAAVPGAAVFSMMNRFSLRVPLYPGMTILDDLYSIVPFDDPWMHFPKVLGADLKALVHELGGGESLGYYSTSVELDDETMYDFHCGHYDSTVFEGILNRLFEGKYAREVYVGFTQRSILSSYISSAMPCSS